MKKIIKIVSLFIIAAIMAGCAQGSGGEENFSKTTVFNPNSTKVKLIGVSKARSAENDDVVCEVDPFKTKEVELGDDHEYYFTDAEGNKIADLSKSDSGQYLPVYLELNLPKENTEYLILNQYKTDCVLEDYIRYDGNGGTYNTYNLYLYEIVNKDDLDAYKYDANTYIRTYPSANCWVDNEAYASNTLGTKITYTKAFFDQNFEDLSNPWAAWGWSTYNEEFDTWFCHRVVSFVLKVKNGEQITKAPKFKASVDTFIQAVYSENPDWKENWSIGLPTGDNTKWKVSEIWLYSDTKLYFDSKFYSKESEFQNKLQEKLPGCKVYLIPINSNSYTGWMPQNSKYALCIRLESRNCYVQNVWCENVATSLLKEVYESLETDAKNLIINN